MRLLGISKREEWLEDMEATCAQMKLVKFKACGTIEEAECYFRDNDVDSLVILCESFDFRSFLWIERLCEIRDNIPVIMVTDNVNNELYLGAIEIRVADIIVGDYDAKILDAALDKVVYSNKRTSYELVHRFVNDSKNASLLGAVAV